MKKILLTSIVTIAFLTSCQCSHKEEKTEEKKACIASVGRFFYLGSKKTAFVDPLKGTVLGTHKTEANGTLWASFVHQGLVTLILSQNTELDS